MLLDPSTIAGDYKITETDLTLVGVNVEVLADNNPRRVYLLASSSNLINLAFSTRPDFPVGFGFLGDATAFFNEWRFDKWGSIVGYEWFVRDAIGGSTVTVFEVELLPGRVEKKSGVVSEQIIRKVFTEALQSFKNGEN